MEKTQLHALLQSEDFRRLVAQRWSISLALTVVTLLVYFGFILLVAFNKPFLATLIGTHMTLGIPLGIAVIIIAWVLTGIYVGWANRHYDSAVERLRQPR